MSHYEYVGPSVFGYETDQPVTRAAMISLHTSPIEPIGHRDAGGMNVYIRSLALQLARQGLQIDIFTRRVDPDTPEIVNVAPSVNVIHITAGPTEHIHKNELFPLVPQFAEQMALFALRTQRRYDVLHAHYWLSGWAAHLLQRYWHIPHLLMFHTTAHQKNRVANEPDRETDLRLATERSLIELADGIVAASPDERQDLLSLMRSPVDKICAVPPGVDLSFFHAGDPAIARVTLGLDPDARYVLAVGRIDPIKGFDTLLDAIATVPSAHLLLVGGDLAEDGTPVGALAGLAAQAATQGINDRVTFLGSQPHDWLATAYQAADVVVVPSRYESFGLVAIEAMASGTPVVASNVGGLRYTVETGHSGYLIPHSDPVVLADALNRLLTDDALRARLSEGAIRSAQRFSWESVGTQIAHLYDRLIAGTHEELCAGANVGPAKLTMLA